MRFTKANSSIRSRNDTFGLVSLCLAITLSLIAHSTEAQLRNPGLSGDLAGTEADILQALTEVVEDQVIHGTYIFDKDPTLTGAEVVDSTPLFEPWTGTGKVFYKIRKDAIAPRHFLESADQGTIGVRYVLMTVSPERMRLSINAVYVEKTHKRVHISDGTVESSEFKEIKNHLEAIQMTAQEAADAKRRRDSAELVQQIRTRQHEDESTRLAAAESSVKDLDRQIHAIRHEVERRVKAPGAELRAAPFREAASLKTLAAFTDVVIVIVTPHWYGVETPDGQRGWLPVEQLEALP